MNYFYASNGLLIKKNIIENLEMEEEEDNKLSLIDYLNKIEILSNEINELKNEVNGEINNLKGQLNFDFLPKDSKGKNLKFITDVSNDWNIDNDIIFIDVNYDLDTFFPQIYTQIVENNIISEKYLFSVIKNPENKSFRVTIHISVDDKLNFVKDNLSLNYLVIG